MTEPKDQPKRTCVECKHWRVDGWAQECERDHWHRLRGHAHHWRRLLLKGNDCPDFNYADAQYSHPDDD